ncbi:MAG TPA: hypothetical protein VFU17_10745 [Candidatus Limnocylindrales bacterium]|nr:hypothetical protein [Candidatus Limnocylindrales bacterium]
MAARQASRTEAAGGPIEATVLARLGLSTSASAQDVESAHDSITDFLSGAPPDIRPWALAQINAADEAYALLSDPTMDRSVLATPSSSMPTEPTVTAPAPAPAQSARPPAVALAARPERRRLRRLAGGALAILGVVVVAVAGYNLNGGTGVPPVNGSPAPEAAASTGVDPALVTPLMENIQQNPKDITSLQALADLYYQAGDFATSRSFLRKVVEIDARNVVGQLALGATEYNLGDAAAAEQRWRAVLDIDKNNVDAHYYLGFMYLTREPPDMAQVKAEWDQVVAIAPDSDVARSVSQHLASLAASPGPEPASSGAPTSVPSPASDN